MQKKTRQTQKRVGLKVRTDIRAGYYFSITLGAGVGTGGGATEGAPAAG